MKISVFGKKSKNNNKKEKVFQNTFGLKLIKIIYFKNTMQSIYF